MHLVRGALSRTETDAPKVGAELARQFAVPTMPVSRSSGGAVRTTAGVTVAMRANPVRQA